MTKTALLIVAAVMASMVFVTSSGGATKSCPPWPVLPGTTRLTVKFLKIYDRPIRVTHCGLVWGSIWDRSYPARPGDGRTMVIDAYDVTPVWGYDTDGRHGPFYHLNRIKPGMMLKVKWRNRLWHYRFVARPKAHPRCLSVKQGARCVRNNRPIKHFRVETLYLRTCWPRYTCNDYMTARAVLVRPKT